MPEGQWTMRRAARHLISVLAALALACGGGGDSGETKQPDPAAKPVENREPERGDWQVGWLLADPENLNPLTANDSASSSVLSWIMSPLLTLDNETLEQRPVIAAELPQISEDKLTYTFRLRDDVTFSDGKPLTADDVVFTVKAIKNPEVLAPHTRNYFESVHDVVAVSPHVVRFDLRKRYFRNTLVLGSIQPMPAHYYDPEGLLKDISIPELEAWDTLAAGKKKRAARFAKALNEDFDRRPLGPGAFVLKNPETDLITGERVVLHRRDDFWAPGDSERGDAWVERVVFRVINDREAALVAFKGGDLDLIGLTPLQHKRQTSTARFKQRADKKVHLSPGYSYIGWNSRRPVFSDVRVRRAMKYFIDKDSIIEKVLLELGVPVEGSIFVERPEYNQNLPKHVFDPQKGKALLAEAGWKDSDGDGVLDKEVGGKRTPLRFEIIANTGNDIRKSVGLVVIDEMKRAGIDASFRQMDWSIMLQKVRGEHDFDAVILGWAMNVTEPDPYQLWHSTQSVSGGSNHCGFKNEEVDGILEAYRVEFDPAKRKELMDRFQMIVYDQQPYAFLFMGKGITAWDRRFENVNWYPSGGTDRHEWWVPTERQKY